MAYEIVDSEGKRTIIWPMCPFRFEVLGLWRPLSRKEVRNAAFKTVSTFKASEDVVARFKRLCPGQDEVRPEWAQIQEQITAAGNLPDDYGNLSVLAVLTLLEASLAGKRIKPDLDGVYATHLIIDGKRYDICPTELERKLLEFMFDRAEGKRREVIKACWPKPPETPAIQSALARLRRKMQTMPWRLYFRANMFEKR